MGIVQSTVTRPTEVVDGVRLRPPGRTAWQAAAVSLLAAFGPVAVTLLVLTGPGRLGALSLGAGVLALGCVALAHRFSTLGLVLAAQGVTEHRLVGRRRTTPPIHVRSALVLPLLDDRTLRTHLQLFLLDEQDRTRLRLRGQWWSDDQIAVVARHFDVPVTRQSEPVSLAELRQSRRAQLSPAERHPALTVAVTTVVAILLAVVVVALALDVLG